jgi:hypothetical protein
VGRRSPDHRSVRCVQRPRNRERKRSASGNLAVGRRGMPGCGARSDCLPARHARSPRSRARRPRPETRARGRIRAEPASHISRPRNSGPRGTRHGLVRFPRRGRRRRRRPLFRAQFTPAGDCRGACARGSARRRRVASAGAGRFCPTLRRPPRQPHARRHRRPGRHRVGERRGGQECRVARNGRHPGSRNLFASNRPGALRRKRASAGLARGRGRAGRFRHSLRRGGSGPDGSLRPGLPLPGPPPFPRRLAGLFTGAAVVAPSTIAPRAGRNSGGPPHFGICSITANRRWPQKRTAAPPPR